MVFSLLLAAGAAASPESSVRPVERGESAELSERVAPERSQRPNARSVERETPSKPSAKSTPGVITEQSLRPRLRGQKVRRAGRENARMRRAGAVCGDIDIQGEVVGRVSATIAGCGVSDAVRIRAVSNVGLSIPSVMDCTTAKALKAWIVETAKPVLKRKGGGLRTLRVAAHYKCRTRNNQPGSRISEHGKGRAIDISGVQLKDGSTITVLKGWNAASTSKIMRQLHKGACGPFGTVLGPDGDRFHKDHFHFDTARYRSGTFCR